MGTSRDERVPDWLLERLHAGELSHAQAEAVRQRLAATGEGARLAALQASDTEILAALPPHRVVTEVRHRMDEAQRRHQARATRGWWALSMTTACATVLAMVLAIRASNQPDQGTGRPSTVPAISVGETDERIAIKGDSKPAVLRIYRKTKDGNELLGPDARLRKGDTLQIRYLAAGRQYGVIASIDALGAITFHLPEAPGPAAALERDGERAVSHAFELDDSPGFERFVFITSNAPFSTRDILPALKHGTTLPPAFTRFEMALKKEGP